MRVKQFFNSLIIGAALLAAPLVASAQGWTEFRAPDGFAVQMPSKPSVQSGDEGTIIGHVRTNVYLCHTNHGDYTVAVTQLPGLAVMLGGNRIWTEARKEFLKENHATEVSWGKSSFAGHPSHELRYTNNSNEGRCEMFLVGHRMYVVDANHSHGMAGTENENYFSSFHLLPNIATGD